MTTILIIIIWIAPITASTDDNLTIENQYQTITTNHKTEPIELMIIMEVPIDVDTTFKAWMSHTAITDTKSEQWYYRLHATTDELGFRRIGEHYVVAMGTYYGTCGDRFKISLSSGREFKVIIGDSKADIHTDEGNMYRALTNIDNTYIYNSDGVQKVNLIEFIIDETIMADYPKYTLGDISTLYMDGYITKIEKIIGE